MKQILRIDSSSRPGSDASSGSHSRALADHIVDRLRTRHPGAELAKRDLIADPIPHISDKTITGFYTPPAALTDDLCAALSMSDSLIAELMGAEAIVLSVPIYNFSVPSALKAWIDQITRMNNTFAYEDGQFRGLVPDRPVYVAYAYGAAGYGPGGALESYDFMRPYLTLLLNFIGLRSVESFSVEATTADDPTVGRAMAVAMAAVDEHFA